MKGEKSDIMAAVGESDAGSGLGTWISFYSVYQPIVHVVLSSIQIGTTAITKVHHDRQI